MSAEGRTRIWGGLVIARIDADIDAGIMPADVASFSALHDYVDANMYLVDAMGDLALDFSTEASTRRVNEVATFVDGYLAGRAGGRMDCGCSRKAVADALAATGMPLHMAPCPRI